ncbi:hypothetical protein [Pseudomonas oryzihabitans]|uniref:hypothetical protein n=1 Tax=Pseudomonas oryzihabitans TaxID=47885 RepID=UPI00123C433D|nr:hypothetical protein [Pseudomonas oryzihabitans]QEU01836.1 hypothetical protein FOB65_00415 [Pseudomonas oryzihabitans]
MSAVENPQQIDCTLAVIRDLNQFEPRSVKDRRTPLENRAEWLSTRCMVIAVLATIASWIIAGSLAGLGKLDDSAKLSIQVAIITSVILALSSLLIPIVASIAALWRWKTLALTNLQDDIRHEQSMGAALARHPREALVDAKYWLELKISRLESRVSSFFGEKIAILTLLASSYLFTKEFGGFKWLSETLAAGPQLSNAGNMSLLFIAAGVLGMSVGAVLIRYMAGRYRYQVELIEGALR